MLSIINSNITMINPGDLWCDTWEMTNQSLFQFVLTNNDNQIFALYVWTDGNCSQMYTSSTADFTQGCQPLVQC